MILTDVFLDGFLSRQRGDTIQELSTNILQVLTFLTTQGTIGGKFLERGRR